MNATRTVYLRQTPMFDLTMDAAEASAPILIDGDQIPMQTADASHRWTTAAIAANDWSRAQGGEYWAESDDSDIVIGARH